MLNDKIMGRYDGGPVTTDEDADWIILGFGDTEKGYTVGLVEFGEVHGSWWSKTRRAAENLMAEKRLEQRTLGEMLRTEERGHAYERV